MLRAHLLRSAGLVALPASVLAVLVLLGCDTTKLAANSTAGVFERASPAFEQYWDYETAGSALPASIMQLEGIARIIPENEKILLQLTRSYCAYAYGWIEDDVAELELSGHYDEAEEQRVRARQMYLRARDLGKHFISLDHEGMDAAVEGGLDSFNAWLEREFEDPEDAKILFWTGYAWGSYINASLSDMSAVADLPFAKALVERSVGLDPEYYNASGLAFLGVATAKSLSGNLDQAREHFDRALEITDRRALLILVNMADTYAVREQDRQLYIDLLTEVLEAGNVLPEARLNNRVAKRRAARLLRQVDDRFLQASSQ